MAGQSIPRFDLYAALGVDPSADDAAIEAAYWDLFGKFGGDADAAVDRRIVRARLAREWLTDPDRRSRYDASRARAAARAAAKATATAGTEDGLAGAAAAELRDQSLGDEGDDDGVAEDTIPWPAADLARQAAAERRAAAAEAERQAAADAAAAAEEQAVLDRHPAGVEQSESNIAWSATPADSRPTKARAVRGDRATRSERRQMRYIGWGAVIVAIIAVGYLVFTNFGGTDVAVRDTPTPPPEQQTEPPATTPPVTEAPTVTPSVEPTAGPATQAPPDTDTIAMQQASWQVLQSVMIAASDGDVATVQTLVGTTAPGLRASGLRRATFPTVTADQITITQDATGYVAMADEVTRLTSVDGTTWTFDYGDRPLATYRTSKTDIHDLWWEEKDGQHHLHLKIVYATVSKQQIVVQASWTYDPERPDDATYFKRATFILGGPTFDGGEPVTIAGPSIPMVGGTSIMAAGQFATEYPWSSAELPNKLSIPVTITNPRTDGGAPRAIDTTFLLAIR